MRLKLRHLAVRPRVEVHSLGKNLADTMEHAQINDPTIPYHTDTAPTFSSHTASRPADRPRLRHQQQLMLSHWPGSRI